MPSKWASLGAQFFDPVRDSSLTHSLTHSRTGRTLLHLPRTAWRAALPAIALQLIWARWQPERLSLQGHLACVVHPVKCARVMGLRLRPQSKGA
jgi:hypothetical protein